MDNREVTLKVLKNKIGNKEVADDTRLDALGLDSLDLVEMILELEEEVGVEFKSEEISKLVTISDVFHLVDSKTK